MPDPDKARALVYDLAVHLTAFQTTSFRVGEYYQEDVRRYPELFVADGILYLALERENLRAGRQLEVLNRSSAWRPPGGGSSGPWSGRGC